MLSLPCEVKLDIFKFFSYEELCSIKQTNLYFRDFIDNFEGELAREKFHSIYIEYLNQSREVPHKLKVKEDFDFDFFAEQQKEINEQIEQKWSNGLQDQIRLYLPDRGLIGYSSIICLTRVHDNERRIRIQLPNIIKTKNDIKIVYYHLNKLFNCYFVYANFNNFIFNPELLQLLFGNAKLSKQFYVMRAFLMPSKAYTSENLIKFVVNHLICKFYVIKFIFKYYTKEYINILNKILINGDKFKNVNIICSHSIPELFDLVINVGFLYVLFFFEIKSNKPQSFELFLVRNPN
uniref:F-box domain-containing protein n=1 Tax=Meloidogyne enterolobii TaxID=390850 RepID=A0A6V7XL41_MELEN|nr:unnamed protein product [Meloidogyne enterolobii]